MNVGKIFKVLIIVVACVIIGALVLNILLPNTATSLVNAIEDQVYNATGMNFDFNGDNNDGANRGTFGDMNDGTQDDAYADGDEQVEGFQ